MKKLFLLIMMLPFLMGCSNNDDANAIDCSLYDPAVPILFIKTVDAAGENMLENGTFDPEHIQVEGDFTGASFQFMPENEFANPDAEIRKLDNTLSLFIPSQPAFTYKIHLNDTETITLNFTAELTEILCNITFYKPTSYTYNDEAFTFTEVSPLQFLATIVL